MSATILETTFAKRPIKHSSSVLRIIQDVVCDLLMDSSSVVLVVGAMNVGLLPASEGGNPIALSDALGTSNDNVDWMETTAAGSNFVFLCHVSLLDDDCCRCRCCSF